MYNLLVSGRDEVWEGESYLLQFDRCVREYADNELTARFGNLDAGNHDELRRLPCICAYEAGCRKDPKFGVFRNVTVRRGMAKIEYDIIEIEQFPTEEDLRDDGLAFDLDISKWEMNRTHWHLKI
jgi:hypothetical protein